MVDMFHEVGLVSSVPNCRTTVFTVHCIASWYVAGQVIRNTHYSRNPQVKQRIKANHKSPQSATCNVSNETVTDETAINALVANGTVANSTNDNDANESNSLSLSSNQIDKGITAHQSDGQTIEQRDEYTSKHSEPVSRDNSNEVNGREKEQFYDGDAPTTQTEVPLFPSITLPDATSNGDSPGIGYLPPSEQPDNGSTDATATAPAGAMPSDAV